MTFDFLALYPRLSSSGLGGVTPDEQMKQQHSRVRVQSIWVHGN